MEALIEQVFSVPGALLESGVNRTGLRWGIVAPSDFWHRTPAFHIFEAAFFLPLALFTFVRFFRPYIRAENSRFPVSPKPPFFSDMVLGNALALCFLSQVVFKAMRPNALVQLFWLLMPCHVVTAAWAVVLLQRPGNFSMTECRIAATFLTLSGWGAFLGMATPDWSDHRFRIEGVVFYIHHALLAYAPFHWAFNHGMRTLTLQLLGAYFFPCLVGNFFIYTPLAYVSGLNVNYNLYPPKVIAALFTKRFGYPEFEQYYRFVVPIILTLTGCVVWFAVWILSAAWRRFSAAWDKMTLERKVREDEVAAKNAKKRPSTASASNSNINHSAAMASSNNNSNKKSLPENISSERPNLLPVGPDGYVNPGGYIRIPKRAEDEAAARKRAQQVHRPVPKG